MIPRLSHNFVESEFAKHACKLLSRYHNAKTPLKYICSCGNEGEITWDCFKWHVDHIFPIKAFVDNGIYDLSIINSLDNLRPLKAKDNCVKNDEYDQKLFMEFLKKHEGSH